jgi:hypothetical protein
MHLSIVTYLFPSLFPCTILYVPCMLRALPILISLLRQSWCLLTTEYISTSTELGSAPAPCNAQSLLTALYDLVTADFLWLSHCWPPSMTSHCWPSLHYVTTASFTHFPILFAKLIVAHPARLWFHCTLSSASSAQPRAGIAQSV